MDKINEAVQKLKEVELEYSRTLNALEMMNRAHDAKKEWVGLTDEERANCSAEAYGRHFVLCELIEAKLKEKNNG